MVDIFLPREIASKWDADNFVQDAWKQVSDIWAQQANAAAPDLALQAEQQAQQKAIEDQRAQERAAYQQQSDAATQAGLQQAMQEQYGQQQAQQWAAQAYGQAATATTGVAPLQTAPAAPAVTDQGQSTAINGNQPQSTSPDTSGMPSGAAGNYVAAAWQAAQKYGLDPQTFVKQIQQESGFQPFNADGTPRTSPAGAIGIAQFMPGTAQGVGVNPTDPLASLDAAAKMMAGYVQKYGGDMAKALAAYNAGPGNVDKFGGVPPFAETQNYVKTILGDAAGLGQQLTAKAQQGLGAAGQAVTGAAQQAANYVFPVAGYQGGVNLHWGDVPGGSDLFADRGTPVVAMRGGKVVEAGYNSVGGNSVLIQGDDGNQYYYAHFDQAPSVKVGQTVQPGAYLGPVGNTGDAANTGTHLHIGIGPSILLGADKFGGTGGNFDAVGLLRSVLSGQGTPQAAGPANGPAALAPPTPEAQATASQPLTMGAMQPADIPSAPANGPSGFNPFRAVGDLAGSVGSTVGNAFGSLLGAGGGLLNRPQAGPNDNPGALPSPASLSVGSTPAGTIDPLSGTVPSSAPPLDPALQQGGTGGASLASPDRTPFAGHTAADLITGPLSAVYNSPLRQELLPNISEPNHPFNVMQEMQDKYGSTPLGIPDKNLMTPEDRQRYENATLAVGGMASPIQPGEARPLFGRGGVPGGPVGGLQAPPAPTAPGDVEAALAQSLRNLGMPEEQITALRSAANPPDVAATLGEPTTSVSPPGSLTPPDTTGGDLGASRPSAGIGDYLRALRIGSLAGGIPTLSHIALNTPIQAGLKLLGDVPTAVVTGRAETIPSEFVGMWKGLETWAQNASQVLGRQGAIGESAGGGAKGQALETGLLGLVKTHPVLQDAARQVGTSMEMWRQAAQQATDSGLKPLTGAWQSEVQRLVADPTSDMIDAAQRVGNRFALGGPLGTQGQKMADYLKGNPIGQFILPFFNIGYHVAAQGVETSPAGLLGTGYDVLRAAAGKGPYAGAEGFAGTGGANAVTPLAERVRNNMIGLGLSIGAYNMAAQGLITGNGPDDPNKRQELLDQGWMPDALMIGGRYFDAHVLGPLAVPLVGAANVYEATTPPEQGGYAKPGSSGMDQFGNFLAREGQYFENETFLKSLGQVLQVIGSAKDAGRAGTQELASVLQSVIPQGALLGNVASAMDPLSRKPLQGDYAQAVEQRIPGLREQVPARITRSGQPEPNPQTGLGILLPRNTEVRPDPMLQLLGASGVALGPAPKTITPAAGRNIQLTSEEQQQFMDIRGQVLQQMTAPLIGSTQFAAAPIAARNKALDLVVQRADQAATARLAAQIAQGGGLASRLQTTAQLRPPIPLNTPLPLQASSSPASIQPPQSLQSLPLTGDLSDLDPIQQQEQRRRLAGVG